MIFSLSVNVSDDGKSVRLILRFYSTSSSFLNTHARLLFVEIADTSVGRSFDLIGRVIVLYRCRTVPEILHQFLGRSKIIETVKVHDAVVPLRVRQ